ncbi:Acryloyl-CoA reductase electron transfer subunit beta [Phycisphaerae bacterium RAS1]|nr:Acryloyl-CoA reductase electron transfer subunit beta [Phycisphaerae bacterium RAS1]
MTNDILIFAEQRDNRLNPAAAQLVTPARALAQQSGGKVVAVLIGDKLDAAAEAIDKAGVDRLITLSDPKLALYSALRYRSALAAAIRKVDPRVVLLSATFMGRDLAPRVAMRVGGALATDVVGLKLGDKGLDIRRPLYNGKAFCHVTFPADRVAIASVRLNTFAPASGGGAVRESLAYEPAAGDERISVKEIVRTGGEVKDVTEADIIVSGGRSLKSEENFNATIYPLARELDAAVGASRAACDAGYQPHTRQVGLTGKTVTPKLYFACGVSGAIQHLAGMRGSKVIVAINTDPEAPMMKIADYAVLGDLFKVVPALTEEVRKLKAQ